MCRTSCRSFPQATLEALYALPYAELSAAVLERFLPGFSREELLEYTKKAYASFDDDAVVPLHALGDKLWTMELFHGPTCAFKDVALQILPYLLAASVRKCADDHTVAILVATSGDTGKAALEGFADVPGTKHRGILSRRRRFGHPARADGRRRAGTTSSCSPCAAILTTRRPA